MTTEEKDTWAIVNAHKHIEHRPRVQWITVAVIAVVVVLIALLIGALAVKAETSERFYLGAFAHPEPQETRALTPAIAPVNIEASGVPLTATGSSLNVNCTAGCGTAPYTLGQKAMTASVPVVIASDQSRVGMDPQGPDSQAATQTGKPIQNSGRNYADGKIYTIAVDANGVQQFNQVGGTVTLNTASPLTGGGTVGFGSTLNFACPTCSTGGFSNPMTTLGDIIYGASSGTPTRLGANSTGALNFLTSLSSAVPVWTPATIANIGAGTSSANYILTGNNTVSNLDNVIYVDGTKYPASGSASSTTGSITSGQPTLTLTSALDFKNGQGIAVLTAGPAVAISGATAGAVTTGGTAGGTTYQYQAVLYDYLMGATAPSTAATIATGNATLTNANYNKYTFTVPTGTFAAVVYGRTSGSMVYLGKAWCANGISCQFFDTGLVHDTRPTIVPNALPAGAVNEALITTISSGAGTTTLTLAANAGATATTQSVYHDDSVAINAAFTAANALGGATVFIPLGTYYTMLPQNSPPANRAIFYLFNYNNLRIAGTANSGTVITTLHPGGPHLFEINGGANIEIEHIKTVQSSGGHMDAGSNTPGSAIRIENTTNPRIHDNEIAGGQNQAIWTSGGTLFALVFNNYIYGNSQTGITLDNCDSVNSYNTCGALPAPRGITFSHNRIVNIGEIGNPQGGVAGGPGGSSIASDAGGAELYLTISNNYIESLPGQFNYLWGGIRIGSSNYVTVIGNVIKKSDDYGIQIAPNGNALQNVSVVGNVIDTSGTNCIMLGNAVNLTLDQVTIAGNSCYLPFQYGIVTLAPNAGNIVGLTIVGNTIEKAGLAGVNVYDAMNLSGQHMTISGNVLNGLAQSRYGIALSTTSSDVTIANNDIYGMATGNVLDANRVASQIQQDATGNIVLSPIATKAVIPVAAGTVDFGTTALPFANLWLGTAATNNFKFQPAATAAARVISMPDPLGAVNMPYVIVSGTSAMTTAGVTTGACGTTVTTPATGTATTDAIEFSRNAAPTNANGGNLILNSWVTSGNVNFNYCNPGAATVTPTAMTLNWRVIR